MRLNRTLAIGLGCAALLATSITANAQGFWSPPTVVVEVSSTGSDYYPFISADLATIRVASSRGDLPAPPPPAAGWHLWYAKRNTRYGLFGPMTAEPGAIQTASNDLAPWVLPGDTTMWSATNAALGGGVGGFDIWEWTRPNAASPWALVGNVTGVNTSSTDYMPSVTSDGLEMYVTASNQIVKSTRINQASPWGKAAAVPELAGHGHSGVSMNGLEIYTAQGGQIHVASRRGRLDSFSKPQAMTAINNNASGSNNRPSLAIDGRELFFSSTRPANTPGIGSTCVWTSRWTGLSLEGLPTVGGTMKIHITNATKAGAIYQVGMSFTNNTGVPIPGVGTLPLDADSLLFFSTGGSAPGIFTNFSGNLDTFGEGTASLNVPNIPLLKGIAFEVAAVTVGGTAIDYITNGISTRID